MRSYNGEVSHASLLPFVGETAAVGRLRLGKDAVPRRQTSLAGVRYLVCLPYMR
jgi:hypothetical protein